MADEEHFKLTISYETRRVRLRSGLARCLDCTRLIDSSSWMKGAERIAGQALVSASGLHVDSGTNNFGQSMIINPELQFSGNNEVATVKLDIFGEVVVTLGTVPQGQGHETTSSQVVAEILGCTPDDVNVRAGHDTYWNSTAGFSGTYASQFAVTGLGAVKGAADKLAGEMKQLAAAVFGCSPDDIELVESQARIKNPRTALSWPSARSHANNEDCDGPDVTLTLVRYMPSRETRYRAQVGNLASSRRTRCAFEIVRTGCTRSSNTQRSTTAATAPSKDGEGQVPAQTHSARPATHEIFTYDDRGTLTTNFYDYHCRTRSTSG